MGVASMAPNTQYHYDIFKFERACCDNLLLKSKDDQFPQDTSGNYEVYLDVEYEPYQCYNASVFHNPDSGTYLYRSKFGNWVVGKSLGKIKKGAQLRSYDFDPFDAREREKFIQSCPCSVDRWQRSFKGEDGKIRWTDVKAKLNIRRQKMSIKM